MVVMRRGVRQRVPLVGIEDGSQARTLVWAMMTNEEWVDMWLTRIDKSGRVLRDAPSAIDVLDKLSLTRATPSIGFMVNHTQRV